MGNREDDGRQMLSIVGKGKGSNAFRRMDVEQQEENLNPQGDISSTHNRTHPVKEEITRRWYLYQGCFLPRLYRHVLQRSVLRSTTLNQNLLRCVNYQ